MTRKPRDEWARAFPATGPGAGRLSGPLIFFGPAPSTNARQVGEVAKGFGVDRRLGADGQGLSNLRDDDANLPRRHLHPRMFGDGINQDELEAEPGHQQVRLVSGFSMEGDRVVFRKRGPKPLAHQSHLRRPDAVDRLQHECDDDEDQHDDAKGYEVMLLYYSGNDSNIFPPEGLGRRDLSRSLSRRRGEARNGRILLPINGSVRARDTFGYSSVCVPVNLAPWARLCNLAE